MNSFGQLLSSFSLNILRVSGLASWICIFRPSLLEFGIALGAQVVGDRAVPRIFKIMILRRYPLTKAFYPEIRWAQISGMGIDEKLALIDTFHRFPARKAIMCFFLSFVAALPAMFVIVFYWEHEVANLVRFGEVLALAVVLFTYLGAAVYIENHDLVARVLAEIHERFDWSDAFDKFDWSSSFDQYDTSMMATGSGKYEVFAILSIWISVLALMGLEIHTRPVSETFPLALEVIFIGLIASVLISRIWYVSKRHVVKSLQGTLDAFKALDPKHLLARIPLHSSSMVARFELTYNQLNKKIKEYDRELRLWTFRQAENSRYVAVGEVAASVVHDLTSPIHVINFCAEQLREDPTLIKNPAYVEKLTQGAQRARGLIESLKDFLQDSQNHQSNVGVYDVFKYVKMLCGMRFTQEGFSKICFELDPELEDLCLKVTRPDLTLTLYNLFANSCSNLLANSIQAPKVALLLEGISGSRATLAICDNGAGFSEERFERLTALASDHWASEFDQKSLGLRLVRRLVESYDGHLKIIPQSGQGTTIGLDLPIHSKGGL